MVVFADTKIMYFNTEKFDLIREFHPFNDLKEKKIIGL